MVTTFLLYLHCHLFHFEAKDTVIARARRQMWSLTIDYIHALLLLLFWWPSCCLENNWQAIYEKFQFNVSPFSIAMQCMWRTKVSSGTISATTADSCDIPYHYQGVSFGKRAAGWSETVLWSAGTVREMVPSSPCLTLISNCEQTLSSHTSRRLITWRRTKEPEVCEAFWVRPLGLQMSLIYANCPEHVLYCYVFYGAIWK